MDSGKKLYKNKSEGKIAGVCAGFAEYFNTDVVLVRILWFLLILASFGLGVFLYIICTVVMIDKSEISEVNYINTSKKLYKNKREGKISGVCAGLAEYFNADVTLIRIFFFLLFCWAGTGIIEYIICAVIIPDKRDLF